MAHDSSAAATCEGWLNPPQIRTYRFLKKLQGEADAAYEPVANVRIGVDRAMGPLVAAMAQAGTVTHSVPLDLNFDRMLAPGTAPREKFYQLMRTYLPAPERFIGKNLVVFLYAERPEPVIALSAMLNEFLAHNRYPATKVIYHVYTSQLYHRAMKSRFETGMLPGEWVLRPIAPANEVQHWFHDCLVPSRFDCSQYPGINVFDPAPVTEPKERSEFSALKAALSSPNL